ncbi:MAG: hypothetical protein BVN32_01665 [Proteobacteria bacterium ST_bin14]|nr:MAG: hypothetical protein BVN32_01665 [Proteobacteria bacterium ST_bin14]
MAGGGAILLGLLIWAGISYFGGGSNDDASVQSAGTTVLDQVQAASDVVTVNVAPDLDQTRGATPMAQRVAVLGLLNKRNGVSRDLTLKPGQAVRVGDVIVRLRACEHTAPWEQEEFTGSFVQVDVQQPDKAWRRYFSGWLYKERPALNVVQHPVYDVWTKSCAMSFPGGGEAVAGAGGDNSRSSAKKSPAGSPETGAAPVPPSAPATAPSTATDSPAR